MVVSLNCDSSTELVKTHQEQYQKLVSQGILSADELSKLLKKSDAQNCCMEDCLMAHRVARKDILKCLADSYQVPLLEYSEKVIVSDEVQAVLDLEPQKKALWVPLSLDDAKVTVVAYQPHDPTVIDTIKDRFPDRDIEFLVALPVDIIRIIEHNLDINPNFPPSAGRTPLARLRTWMANERTKLAGYRTTLAKGRTGLALVRTGLALISIGLLLIRVFGIGFLLPVEFLMFTVGMVMAFDGTRWYLPARKIAKKRLEFNPTLSTFGTTILEFFEHGGIKDYQRTAPIEGAEQLRARWNRLTPVMKRRFLASDRTDFAEERTYLASYRTVMARARTGLACTRTGIAFAGLGIALLRQFPQNAWTFFDILLIVLGTAMAIEGFYWYTPGKQRGSENHDPQDIEYLNQNYEGVPDGQSRPETFSFSYINNIGHHLWEIMFHPFQKHIDPEDLPPTLTIGNEVVPGIWGTTGLALERTLIADRRNIKSGLRTIMAKARTGMAMVRTGTSLASIGLGLLVYFGLGNAYWSALDITLILAGLFFIINGFIWYIPALRNIKEFPYCLADMEIEFPDYSVSNSRWEEVIFSHEDL